MTLRTIRFQALALAAAFTLLAAPVRAQKLDAIHAADFAARTAVQTIYHNLITAGYEWRWIRDEKMPEILIHAVSAIKREAAKMDKQLVLDTFIPTYITSFYAEIDRLNQEHQETCVDVVFVVRTLVPFLKECSTQLTSVGSLTEIAGPVLQAEYSFRICQTLQACEQALGDRYFVVFDEKLGPDRFYKVCVGNND
jgi:hypothetical protein